MRIRIIANPPQQRWPAFAGSIFVHSVVILLALQVPFQSNQSNGNERIALSKQFAVSIIHLQIPATDPTLLPPAQQPPEVVNPTKPKPLQAPRPVEDTPADPAPPSETAAKSAPRRFQLPPRPHAEPVTQTLVQVDVPPDTVAQVPSRLPAVMLWTQAKLPAPRKKFVAPPLQATPQSLPAAPLIEAPNQAAVPGAVNLTPTFINNSVELAHIPTTASPVAIAGPQPAGEVPQIAPGSAKTPTPVNVISQPNAPSRAARVITLPSVNQVAPADLASGAGAVPGGAPGTQPPGETRTPASAAGAAEQTAGAEPSLPGATRLTAPADGKFAVVVLGSPDSTRYPESAAFLRGRAVHTVYLRVGTHKNWILQYAATGDTGRGATIDAPWPFQMMRPDFLNTQANYIMVQGIITPAGDFDQLSLVFPREFDKADFLLAALKLWKFRPARRDGEQAAVEILLTIPRQLD